mmetsp:Transcript_8830/g.20223  ORF Transcript_8830/g.20223 Transcript_8830/m.20223 type:complete len:333 (-) Transcript_8830:77-1075(-)
MSVYSVHDFYAALEVPRGAQIEQIKTSYRRLALKYHPHKCEKSDENAMTFLNISHAYEVLSTPKIRAAYDRDEVEFARRVGLSQDQYNQAKALALFQRFFGTNNPFSAVEDGVEKQFEGAPPPAPPQDVMVDLPCSLEELFAGCTKRVGVQIRRTTPGGDIQSTTRNINVKVEPGWDTGTELRYPKEAEDLTGDIVFVIILKKHELLRRDGDNLLMTSRVPLLNALTGHTVSLVGPDGRTLHVRVDEIIDPTFRKVVKGEGMIKPGTAVNANCRGDLVIDFDIIFPTKLQDLQKDLLRMALRFPVDMPFEQRRQISNALEGKVEEKPEEEEE